MPLTFANSNITFSALSFLLTYTLVFRLLLWKRGVNFFYLYSSASIATKISIGFLVVSLVPILIISTVSFQSSERLIVKNEIDYLESVADFKVQRIDNFFENLQRDLLTAQDYYNVKTNLPIVSQYLNDKENDKYKQAKATLDGQLKTFQRSKGFLEFILVDNEGVVVYITENVHTSSDLGQPIVLNGENVIQLFDNQELIFSPIFKSDFAASGFEILASAPVFGFDNKKIGHIIFAVDMGPVYDLIQDTTGLGETGETLIGASVEPHADHAIGGHSSSLQISHTFFLNPLRYDPDAALNRTIVIGSEIGVPIQESSQGIEGSGVSVDYRGVSVVAAWRHLSSVDWGLVAKIDSNEAFEPIFGLRSSILAITLALIVAVLVLGLLVSRSISRPIQELSMFAEKTGEGDYKQKIPELSIKSKDEIGKLANSFNVMLGRIFSSQMVLREKVDELEKFQKITVGREIRMAELKKQIIELKSGKTKKKEG